MKKTIKYSILGLAALCTVVLCGGYYMLGHALKPEGLITRSRNIADPTTSCSSNIPNCNRG